MRDRLRRLGDLPIYPELLAAAATVSVLAASSASVHALPRPLLVALAVVALIQLLCSGLLRERHLGALMTFVVIVALGGSPAIAVVGGVLIALIVILMVRRGGSLASIPWRVVTRPLNVIAALTLVIATLNAAFAGALTPAEFGVVSTTGTPTQPLPDVYLVLLDGHPRPDTMATDFGLDPAPFLADMASLGFALSPQSHSNYDLTPLTLASMFGMRQVADLPQLADPPASPVGQYRALAHAINDGAAFDALRAVGYEIVTIPSEFTNVTVYSADRVLDTVQMTDLEYELMRAGTLETILPDVQRPVLVSQHRERLVATFARLGELAAERSDRPRFVFAHLMAPHVPISFGPAGEPRSGWPCIPHACSVFYDGEVYRDAQTLAIAGQVSAVDDMVVDAARAIQAASASPPVVIFLSDHGSRYDRADRDEMLRSLFLANTPGHPGLFPADMTPVNLVQRLLGAYAGVDLPYATEESYWLQPEAVPQDGPLSYIPWSVAEPPD